MMLEDNIFSVECIDGAKGLMALPDKSVKLIYGSPPYPNADRNYGNWTSDEYINRIMQSKDKEIVRIKICDIMDHLVNFETLKPSLKKRYMKALETLLEFEVLNNEENNS